MRIRSIKPEFWRSEDIAALAIEDRLLFIGMWSYVDDNGVGIDRLADICADLFALDIEQDPSETFARVSRGLQNLAEGGQIIRYAVEGKKYLYIVNWSKHQRIDKPNKPRHPLPTREDAEIRETPARSSRDSREAPAPGTGEQGNRGTGEENTCSPAAPSSDVVIVEEPDLFDEFWAAYPRKVSKKNARTKFKTACKRASAQEIIEGARRLAADPNLPDDQNFIPHPDTWLNGDRWEDGPLPPRRGNASASDQRLARGLELVQSADQRHHQPAEFPDQITTDYGTNPFALEA